MELTDGEKLIAIMLTDIMRNLKIKGEIDPKFVATSITSGNIWGLKWRYSGLFHGEDNEDAVANEVAAILSMTSFVEYSIGELPPSELAQIPEGERRVFVGFDGNHEGHYGVARYMVEDLHRFSEYAGAEFNSHSTQVPQYRRQVEVFENIARGSNPLNLAQIRAILDA